jgi:hypothetical protein
MNNSNFPSLDSKQHVFSFFKEELVFFYFHFTSNHKYTDFTYFSNRFDNVLSILKKQIHIDKQNTLPFLISFYKLIANTRDIHSGKGERDISYMMLWKLYCYFPSLATYLLYRFVLPIEGQPYAYGSWRDIKYFCHFVKLYSRYQENDTLIDICIELINTQLKKDLDMWKCSPNPMDSRFVSNVAKWIPRENKKFDWLFHKLADHWGKTHYPYIIKSVHDYNSKIKSRNKYKLLYRKNVSFMNKAIDTVEIKLCANKRLLIKPDNIPLLCFNKYKNVVFNDSDNDEHLKCSQIITESIENKFNNPIITHNGYYKYNTSSSLPIYYYVKEAISIIAKYKCKDNSQFRILNKQWDFLSSSLNWVFDDFILPIIDISSSMRIYNDDPLYAAIGFAILISQHSSIKNRILAIDNVPIWIQLDDNMTFIHKVKTIIHNISSLYSTKTSYVQACNFIGNSFLQTSICDNNIRNLQFVFLSSFSKDHYDNYSLYDTISQTFSQYTNAIPHISFWNLSKHNTNELPCKSEQYGTKILSGYSSHLISHLHNRNNSHFYNPYTTVYDILNKYQYQILEKYIQSIIDI